MFSEGFLDLILVPLHRMFCGPVSIIKTYEENIPNLAPDVDDLY